MRLSTQAIKKKGDEKREIGQMRRFTVPLSKEKGGIRAGKVRNMLSCPKRHELETPLWAGVLKNKLFSPKRQSL